MQDERKILRFLFDSSALKVSDPDKAFWYTSGSFGPYYINTHFLYGSEKSATALLDEISIALESPLSLPRLIGKRCMQQYYREEMYRAVIDAAIASVESLDFDLISGGERRDFFFSYPVAELLSKDHLTIYKNGRTVLSDVGFRQTRELRPGELEGRKILHVADLVTEASSYYRAWIPAIQESGARIEDSFAVVDRGQGGRENLAENGVALHTLIDIGERFFDLALREGLISSEQKEQLVHFYQNPEGYMQRFLAAHPDFLARSAAADPRIAKRVDLYCQRYGIQDREISR